MLRRLLPLALFIPLVLSGCDTSESSEDTFFLDARRVDFEFDFEGDALTPGEFTELQSEAMESLVDYILDSNFSLEQVVSVRLQPGSGDISVRRPIDASIGFIDRARLRLLQGTRAPLVVALDTDFPMSTEDRSASLEIETADLAAFAVTGPFGALLDLDPVTEVSGGFLVTVSFDVIVEVRP